MRKKCFGFVARACLLVLLASLLAGCGSGSAAPIGCSGAAGGNTCVIPEFLYATAQNEILGFTVNPVTGMLSDPTTAPMPGSIRSTPSIGIVSISNLGFVYVSDPLRNQVDSFAVSNGTGALTPLSGSPFPLSGPGSLGVGFLASMIADAQGKFLYVANGAIDVFAINSTTGALTAVPGPPITEGSGFEIAMDPSGKFLYASAGEISAFTVDSNTGVLTPVAGSPFALPVRATASLGGLSVDSTGRFLYCVAQSLPIGATSSGFVEGFAIDAATGALTPIPGSPSFRNLLSPFAIASSGGFLYASGAQGTSVFGVAPGTGVLTESKVRLFRLWQRASQWLQMAGFSTKQAPTRLMSLRLIRPRERLAPMARLRRAVIR